MKTILPNGLQIAYERRGAGIPLALLHGYPLDHHIWEAVIPWLKDDFDLILPDLRGFGRSASSETSYTMSDMAADVAALLDSLGMAQAIVAGHSMGGYVALAFARSYPQRTLGLGLVASQILADSPEKKVARYQEAEHILAHGVLDVAEGMPGKLTADPALQARLKALILRQRPEGLAGALRAMAERPDSSPCLPMFDFPVVVIHGAADQLVPVERARQAAALAKHGHLVEVEKAGHMPMMEAPSQTAGGLRLLR